MNKSDLVVKKEWYHAKHDYFMDSYRKKRKCKYCGSILYKDLMIDNIGVPCGCLKNYIRDLKEQIKELKEK